MSYIVLARKWRPLTFDAMVGQEFISSTLKNAVQSGRVAHAFLFTGSRGVGKTSAARILAKCLNCDQGVTPEPCNRCTSCQEITEGRSLEVYEIDGASNTSVDDVRELRDNIRYLPRPGKRRIYIIDEVHMLSKSAFNALLKTLEEPPEHVVFIFATTEPHRVPETIQSRCQRFDFRRIPRPKLLQRLREMVESEKIRISDHVLGLIAKAADGSMRDAQSLLDQAISFCGDKVEDEAVMEILGVAGPGVFSRISESVLAQNAGACLEVLDEVYQSGYDLAPFYRDLVEHFRNLLMVRLLSHPEKVLHIPESEIEDLRTQAAGASKEDLQRLLNILLKSEKDVLQSGFPRTGLETTLVRMAFTARLEPLEKILERISALEQSISGQAGTAGAGVSQSLKPSTEGPHTGLKPISGRPAPHKPAEESAKAPQRTGASRKPGERNEAPPPGSRSPAAAGEHSDRFASSVPPKNDSQRSASGSEAPPRPGPAPDGEASQPSESASQQPGGASGGAEEPSEVQESPATAESLSLNSHESPVSEAAAVEKLLEALRKEQADSLVTLLEKVDEWEVGPDLVTVYCQEGSFVYQRLRQKEVREQVTRAIQACFGTQARFRVCPLEERSQAPRGKPSHGAARETGIPPRPNAPQVPRSPAVQDALEVFRGTITDVKEGK